MNLKLNAEELIILQMALGECIKFFQYHIDAAKQCHYDEIVKMYEKRIAQERELLKRLEQAYKAERKQ